MEQKQFSEEELAKVKGIQEAYAQVTVRLGQLHMERLVLDGRQNDLTKEIDKVEVEFQRIKSEEQKITSELVAKYGDGELNPTTGVFTPKG